jgi:hypothetical protein
VNSVTANSVKNKNINLIDDFGAIFGGPSESKVNNNNINNIFGSIDLTSSAAVIDLNQNLINMKSNNSGTNIPNTNDLISNLGSVIYLLL